MLLMHPFLVHSASPNYSRQLRLAFNLGVRWLPGGEGSGEAAERLDPEELRRRHEAGLACPVEVVIAEQISQGLRMS